MSNVPYFDDDAYRSLLAANAGVTSSLDLTDATFKKVMRAFRTLGFVSTSQLRKAAMRSGQSTFLRSPAQLQVIDALYEVRGWTLTLRKEHFNKKCCGKKVPLTKTDARKVIEGSKAVGLRYIVHLEKRLTELRGLVTETSINGAIRDLRSTFNDLSEPAQIIDYTRSLHAQIAAIGGSYTDLQERQPRAHKPSKSPSPPSATGDAS